MITPENDPTAVCSACGAEMEGDSTACFHCGHARRSPPLKKGQVIADRYELTGVLGLGGMGTVYQAHDRSLDERVALKVLSEAARGSADADRRFRAEIRLARKIRHPNVCAIHEYGEFQDIQYIVMEFVDGQDLKKYVRSRGKLWADEAIDIARQIGEGLQAIHDAGVIHRDLKLANVMRDGTGRLRLMDFGIAKGIGDTMATVTGQILGTPEYMSPEQVQGGPVDARADIYALGIITYELLTGRVPFKANTPLATIMLHVQEPPRLDDPGIPDLMVPVLGKALAKKPEERYESARAFVAALTSVPVSPSSSASAQVPQPIPSAARHATTITTTMVGTPGVAPLHRTGGRPAVVKSSKQGPSVGTSSGRRWGVGVGAAGGALLGLGATVWLAIQVVEWSRSGQEREPPQPISEQAPNVTVPEPAVTLDRPQPTPAPLPTAGGTGIPRATTPASMKSSGQIPVAPSPRASSPTLPAARPVKESPAAATPMPVAVFTPLPPPIATGPATLVLTSSASGAITVDGDPRGRTPLTLSLAAGTHSLVLSSDDGRTIQQQVTLAAGERVEHVLRFPGFGGLSVTSTVWVNVSVDEGPARATPVRFDRLTVGRHVLRAFREGYEEQRIEVEIREGEVARHNLELKQR